MDGSEGKSPLLVIKSERIVKGQVYTDRYTVSIPQFLQDAYDNVNDGMAVLAGVRGMSSYVSERGDKSYANVIFYANSLEVIPTGNATDNYPQGVSDIPF